MKPVSSIFFLLALSFFIGAQTPKNFDRPWENPATAIVIDAFHGNSINWRNLETDARVVGILHKATEGFDFTDSKYSKRKSEAKKRGFKWGSFHLLRKGNPIQQAQFYLKTIGKNNANEIMALDIECTDHSQCNIEKFRVSIEEIKSFLNYVKEQTGRYPIFYGNHSVIKDLSTRSPNDNLLKKIPLWYARFKSKVADLPKGIWKTYVFWQFSSEINCAQNKPCLYRAPGTEYDMDINVYNGSVDELRKKWNLIGNVKERECLKN